jgi:hypothetical protein
MQFAILIRCLPMQNRKSFRACALDYAAAKARFRLKSDLASRTIAYKEDECDV